MKPLLVFLTLLLYHMAFSQKYAMIDHAWKKPMILTDSVSKGSFTGYFVMYTSDIDSLIVILDTFRNIKDYGMHRTTFNSSDFYTANIQTDIVNISKAFGDSYDITVTVVTDKTKASFKLSESRINLPSNQEKIRAFYSYLKKGKKAWEGYLK